MSIVKILSISKLTVAITLLISLTLLLVVLFSLSPVQSAVQERSLKIKPFKDMPVAVRQIKNLQSETWFSDLQIEVKNVSTKPIYFMAVYLIFPDERVAGNGKSGILLTYGNPKNGNINRYADPKDEHLEPGETHLFTVPAMYRKGLETKHKKIPSLMKNLMLKFSMINFGDGTGFEAGSEQGLQAEDV